MRESTGLFFGRGPTSSTWPHPGRWRVFAGFWLVYLAYPLGSVVDRAHGRSVPLVLGAAGFLVFCAIYLCLTPPLLRLPAPDRRRNLVPAALFACGTALLPLTGTPGFTTYVFVISAAVVLLPARAAMFWVTACLGLTVTLSFAVPGWTDGMTSVVYSLVATALAVGGFSKLLRTARELLAAREELARLAVATERVRFARDLHDILGHSLTVITVKASLAGRLVTRDPERAGAEIAEIERLGRAALGDVRATVAGYRQVSLPGELASARQVLAAAGIRADLPHAIDEVPGESHELFGWVVREAVTNVVRHSTARTCTIRVWASGVEIHDDGAVADASRPGVGSGLAGLAERVHGADGRLAAGPVADGGFRLRVGLPGGRPAGPAAPASPATPATPAWVRS
ncbi:MAG TPA: sensor histidine kinase [Mycobacteriales bacterium]|nr:sensor histidine kinase [Mycobacteriales bacterium]